MSARPIKDVISIDYSRDALLTDFGKQTLLDRYCMPGEGPQDAFARASVAFSGGDDALAQRLYDYSSKLWFAFATPLLSNGGTSRGLPISCFLNYVDDSVEGLTNNFTENAFLATNGGGIGSYWGNVRSVGEKTSRGVETPGVMPFLHCIDSQMMAYHQGSTRRGSAAAYMDISHPEIQEFIAMRSATGGGDVHRKNETLHHGVCISDDFMKALEKNAPWELIDPHSKIVKEVVSARSLWIKILQQRVKLGEPYLFFTDTANRALPLSQKLKGRYIHASNLCTEIMLATDKDRTAVCCLSSINCAKKKEYWDVFEQFIDDLMTMLDNCLDIFIKDAPPEMHRAVRSAVDERSVGLGTLGWHTLLQQEGISIEHEEAFRLNDVFFARLRDAADASSRRLAAERGEPSDMEGMGERFAHKLAIAPNASSSIFCGTVSPSTEAIPANAFTQKTLSGSHLVKNPALIPVLESYGKNDEKTWSSIIVNSGSVQHLPFLTLWEKKVFKTAMEIDQQTIIDLAAQRQQYICQAQSVNIYLPGDVDVKVLHKLHVSAWKQGLKSLYYLRSQSVKKTEAVNTLVERKIRAEAAPVQKTMYDSECVACEA